MAQLGLMFSNGRRPIPKVKKRKTHNKPKIGIISQHFFNHSVMDFYKNTLINFPDEFHLTIININPFFIDKVTQKLKKVERMNITNYQQVMMKLFPLLFTVSLI